MSAAAFDLRSLQVVAGGRTLFACGELALPRGALTIVIGPNGGGKSTLLRGLAGFHGRCDGVLFGHRICPALAADGRTLAWVGQHPSGSALRLRDYVLLGRRPMLGRWRQAGDADDNAVEAALVALDLAAHAEVAVDCLSGGERQLAAIARAVVQETPALLLDEPGNHLDIHHQHRLMALLRQLAEQGRSVVCVLHDLALAAHYADWLVLVADGRLVRAGQPDAVLSDGMLTALFRWPIRAERRSGETGWRIESLPPER